MHASPLEMNFCRRCGSAFVKRERHIYTCSNGHVIFANASPAVGLLLYNEGGQVLVLERAIDPGKGRLDVPGGFCDGVEPLEDAMHREAQEELGLDPSQYGPLQYVLSYNDPYDFAGEELPVLAVIFRADLRPGAVPVAADDAASAIFMDPNDIDLDAVQFPTVRRAFEWAQARHGN